MQNYNKDSYGYKIRVNFGQDISAATAFSMTIEPMDGDSVSVTPTLGASDVRIGDETFLTDQYVEYTITDGLFDDYTGLWRVKATATVGSEVIATNYTKFRITA